ncbi:DNA (cytosine-5-)-methyltransferase [Spirulina sp. CS-785/01]|uniref:DNA cytosine methyltransferase n=1 Tax=Spirulina sp. CS-785/01 TaxID=3021716 RepID=UPI00232F7057|nr:DNA (cytosine-5-)-methyltransferase [Spirulina sp. CS-785/01]MDB9314495.1 DNA (cytosine-5-)-methyltransferase [Spirulina sp. CS-785/01]
MNYVTLQQASQLLTIPIPQLLQWQKKKLIKSCQKVENTQLFDIEQIKAVKNCHENSSNYSPIYKILQSEDESDFNVLELFAGCGGMALGFENAGLSNSLLVEINQDCINTLNTNRPHWNIIHDDVKNINFSEYNGKVDIVAGGFPCQAFSYAGYGRGFEDTRGTLFFEMARCLSEIQPKIAVIENVRGLMSHDQGKTLETILNTLKELGYNPVYQVLSAQFLDVPQKRERVIILASRQDLHLSLSFPQEKNYTISLREALKNCPPSQGVQYNQRKKAVMELVPMGGNWRDLPVEVQKSYMKNSFYKGGGRTGFAKRLAWDEPALTVTCSPSQTQTERCHPEETRPLTVREYARIQTFPDNWQFAGSLSAQYKQIGNAVPVNMAYHLGQSLIDALRGTTQDVAKNSTVQPQFNQLSIPGLTA